MKVNSSNDWIQQLYVQEITKKKSPEPDFYKDDNGRFVMTESYHIKRGSCCGSKCKHCPYEPIYQKGSKNIQKSLRN
jgi:hypothetical protein